MITSVVVKSNMLDVSFIKVVVGLKTGEMSMKIATYEITDDLKQHIEESHRVCLPCKISEDIANLYVPLFWEDDSIENYIQALMDEMYLVNHEIGGHKTIEQIEESFKLEIILL